MKKLSCLTALLIILLIATPALSLTLSLDPTYQTIPIGDTAIIDLNISGLGDGDPDSLGAFALNITYDETILTFDSVSFGLFLGDSTLGEADTFVDDSTPGLVYLEEGSWLYNWELDERQPASFTLATLTFSGIGIGSSVVGMEYVVLSEAFGLQLPDPILNNANVAPVPEPATVILLGTGIVGVLSLGRKKYLKQ